MGTAYAQVHLRWTIPPALLLWAGLRRLRTRREVYKTLALIIATIPWDSYLIRNKVATVGFGAGSYGVLTSSAPLVADLVLSSIIVHRTDNRFDTDRRVLPRSKKEANQATRTAVLGVAILLAFFAVSVDRLYRGGEWTYMALIVGWVSPFLALLWGVASSHILAMPVYSTLVPILLPTVYLWVCDALALQRGTWVIERATKLGIDFCGLEIEEAIFFLLTNVMVVFGLIACDHCLAIYDSPTNHTFRRDFASKPVISLIKTVFVRLETLPFDRLDDLHQAVRLLRKKSKSFYTANFVFEGRLQLNLLSLYAWCRVADDLVDEAESSSVASENISTISAYLDSIYDQNTGQQPSLPQPNNKDATMLASLDSAQRATFRLLSDLPITRGPLDELLSGFETDVQFQKHQAAPLIADEDALLRYASNVASSIADLCVQLVWAEYGHSGRPGDRIRICADARTMGQALQLVNIARDVPADAKLGRVYLPRLPLATLRRENGMEHATAERLRLLKLARELAGKSQGTIEKLPLEARRGIRAACAVYLEIGEVVEEALQRGDAHGRAKVSVWRRCATAWRALGHS